jgi:hypothetical protein
MRGDRVLVDLEQSNPALIALLKSFAYCELPLNRIRAEMRGLGIVGTTRLLDFYHLCPEPTIRITRSHIEKALAMRRSNTISEEELVDWATTLLTNSVFYWDGEDAKTVSEWINGISLDLTSWSS